MKKFFITLPIPTVQVYNVLADSPESALQKISDNLKIAERSNDDPSMGYVDGVEYSYVSEGGDPSDNELTWTVKEIESD